MNLQVFCDFHHGSLLYSLQLLFEKRLGWNLYRPIGMEWFSSGIWRLADVYPNPADTAKQYLGTDDRHWDQYKNLNGDYKIEDGIYHVYDPVHEIHQKAITLEKFKEMPIDIVISSISAHDVTFANLIREYKPQAKHIAHMGNIYQQTDVANVMCSTKPYPTDKYVVFYHQEFPLDIFKYEPPSQEKKIISFVNLLPAREYYDSYKMRLPQYNMKAYGAGCPDGTITGIKAIAQIMSQSMFGFHVKPGGDGFGHIIHNWYACGRPVIIKKSDYIDKLAGDLLIDDVTCIDLDARNIEENIQKIHYWSQADKHLEMCENSIKRFREVVNFDEEEKKIRLFLERLR